VSRALGLRGRRRGPGARCRPSPTPTMPRAGGAPIRRPPPCKSRTADGGGAHLADVALLLQLGLLCARRRRIAALGRAAMQGSRLGRPLVPAGLPPGRRGAWRGRGRPARGMAGRGRAGAVRARWSAGVHDVCVGEGGGGGGARALHAALGVGQRCSPARRGRPREALRWGRAAGEWAAPWVRAAARGSMGGGGAGSPGSAVQCKPACRARCSAAAPPERSVGMPATQSAAVPRVVQVILGAVAAFAMQATRVCMPSAACDLQPASHAQQRAWTSRSAARVVRAGTRCVRRAPGLHTHLRAQGG
jgi:hypothetical protein